MPGRGGNKGTAVALVRTADRAAGIRRAVELLGANPVRGRQVLLKPNFNTADPYPGSTHTDTLEQLILQLRRMGASDLTIADRSGPANTAAVLEQLKVPALCRRHDVRLLNLQELPASEWVRLRPEGSHWRDGFDVARPVVEAERVVTTCCLKTHGYGGVFTMSLKLSVGIAHKRNMVELHSSVRSMRKMIAEINLAYAPALIVLDGIEAFVTGGPMRGGRKRADVILAGTDRVAIDAVGLAILKDLGTTRAIMEKGVFEQEQVRRAVELGLGVASPDRIELVTDDAESAAYADRLRAVLARG